MGKHYEAQFIGGAGSWQVREYPSQDVVAEYPVLVLVADDGEMRTIDGRAAAEYETARRNRDALGEQERLALDMATAAEAILRRIPEGWAALDSIGFPKSELRGFDVGQAAGINESAAALELAVQAFRCSRRSVGGPC